MSDKNDTDIGFSPEERQHRDELQNEFKSDTRKCPECGAPIDNVRATCSNCGYEYGEKEYDDPEAGTELTAGALVDEQGNELASDGAPEGTTGGDT